MTRWYRAYEGTVTDAKLGEVALVAGCSRSVAIAAWHCILESACVSNDGGNFDATLRRVAVILSEPIPVLERVFSELENLEMIKDGRIENWSKRQFLSDTSTERSRKHRANGKATPRNADATLQQQQATPPDTDTDTDTEKKERKNLKVLSKERRGSRIPDNFEPDATCHELASKLLLSNTQGQEALENFFDYWKSVPGAKGVKLDWQATFRNQLRHVAKQKKGYSNGKTTLADSFAVLDAVIDEKNRRERLGEERNKKDTFELSRLRKSTA